MSSKETIEERLQELGKVISSAGSIVKDVMGRINVSCATEQDRARKPRGELIARRIIMNRFTKLAAAAVIIIAVALSITLFDRSVTPTYAIEQTVDAFRNVRFMHIVCRDDSGKVADERWIEIGPDGAQARYRQDSPSHDFFVIDDRETVLVHHKDKNTVVLYEPKDKSYTWIWNPGAWFKDLAGEGSLIIDDNVDYCGRKAHLVRWLKANQDCYIDVESKLPIAMAGYDISYEQPAEGIFDIIIPDGAVVVDKRGGAGRVQEPQWMIDEQIAQGYFEDARRALAAGWNVQAAELFRRVVEIQPRRNWAWFWMGKAHYELGEYDTAISEFSEVIGMLSKHGIIPHYCYLARGIAYAANDMHGTARRDFDVAVPVMIDTLRHVEASTLFDLADDPLRCADGFLDEDCHKEPSEEQSLAKMINRLRMVTGQNFGYNPDAGAEENEQAIAAWEDWFEAGGEISFTPDAKLVAVPARGEQMRE